MYKSFIIPIEIINRELDSQILLGIKASEYGFATYIGSKRAIFTGLLKNKSSNEGVMLYKSSKKSVKTNKLKD